MQKLKAEHNKNNEYTLCMCYGGRRVEFEFSFSDDAVKSWYRHFKMNFTISRKVQLPDSNTLTFVFPSWPVEQTTKWHLLMLFYAEFLHKEKTENYLNICLEAKE